MRVWLAIVVAAAVVVAVTEAQNRNRRPGPRPGPPGGRRPYRIPSRVELTVAINNPETVKKALACIEGLPCKLDDDYAVMLSREYPLCSSVPSSAAWSYSLLSRFQVSPPPPPPFC